MQNKLLLFFFSAILAYGFLIGAGNLYQVRATVPCPPKGCPPGGCSFRGCGDKCHCRAGCGNYQTCPYCDPNDCSDIYGPGWEKGGCKGAGNCQEKSFSCNCGNGTYTCHKKKEGPSEPPPSEPPPPPTPTTPPPSPTPVQPTQMIDFPLPSPKSFSHKAVQANTNVAAQNWICLQTIPCASGKVQCSGGDLKHRVQISTKKDSKLVPNKTTYIFECVQTDQGYRCTTGDGTLDQKLIGANHIPALSSSYQYQFVDYAHTDGRKITQSDPEQLPVSDGEGNFGPLEWESYTRIQVGRVMMAMQSLTDGDNLAGQHGTQKQGTFTFGDQSNKTTCVMIKWDPHGVVFDNETLAPLEGVKVSLYHRNKDGKYELMSGKELFGGLINPVMTGGDGAFAFYVPNGIYKLQVQKEGYEPVYVPARIDEKAHGIYSQIYDGGDILTQGRLELRNVAMTKITILNTSLRILQNVWQQVEGALR